MNIAIAGATGFVGSRLVELLRREGGHEIAVLTRDAARARARLPEGVDARQWDPAGPLPAGHLAGAEAVVNLAGENVASGRWNAARKRAIRESRVFTTRNLVAALDGLDPRPRVLINASAIGYYGPCDDREVDEEAPPGSDFLADVCTEWEGAAEGAPALGVRTVLLRVGIVLGRGGALAKMLTPFKLGAGGPIGSGRQWMSWIHIDDLCGIILHALRAGDLSGPVNGTAPEPVTNREFARALGKVLHRPAFMPMPGFALRVLVGEFADILLSGQRVLPRRALDSGYEFRFPRLEDALGDVLG